jgi:hypothetical protein
MIRVMAISDAMATRVLKLLTWIKWRRKDSAGQVFIPRQMFVHHQGQPFSPAGFQSEVEWKVIIDGFCFPTLTEVFLKAKILSPDF